MKINPNRVFAYLFLIYSILQKSEGFFRYVNTKGNFLIEL